MAENKTLYCSFCGKSQHEVQKLIAGPASFICNECVMLCVDIINEETETARVAKIVNAQHADLLKMMEEPQEPDQTYHTYLDRLQAVVDTITGKAP